MPPSTIAASRKADSRNTYWSGVTETSTWALTEPATPARNAPPANANSLSPKTFTPIASAAFSSSRMATQPRPIRELLSRTKTRMISPSTQQQQEVVVGEPTQRDPEERVRFTEVEAEELEVGNGRDAVRAVGQVRVRRSPSRLFIEIRKISPKASVTMAR